MNYAEKLLNYRNNHFKQGRWGAEVILSQTDMAKLIGCALNTYVNWEYGVNLPCKWYKPKVDELLSK